MIVVALPFSLFLLPVLASAGRQIGTTSCHSTTTDQDAQNVTRRSSWRTTTRPPAATAPSPAAKKALIALAVPHSKQCPCCVDAYAGKCVDTEATVAQMYEAVHVAAALAAGIDLVHATQMHKALERRGALSRSRRFVTRDRVPGHSP